MLHKTALGGPATPPPANQPPSVADQIALKPPKPIKPLPKEAFEALQAEPKKAPAQHPGTKVTNAGIVISHHHSTAGKHTATWLIILALIAAAAFAGWYFFA